MTVLRLIRPKGSKKNFQKWFDGEVLENINTRGKLFKKFKKSRLHIDKELYKKAKYNTLKLIASKNKHFSMINSQKILENQKKYGKP